MKEVLLLKILCGACGKLIGRVVEIDGATAYRMTVVGGVNADPATIFCVEHGWPDLESLEVAAKIADTRKGSKATTHRARCSPHLPGPR